jgi:bifunctional non-homologous end joining protein LigD
MAGSRERSERKRRGATRNERDTPRPRPRPTELGERKSRGRRGAAAAADGRQGGRRGSQGGGRVGPVEEQLQEIENSGGSGTVQVARGKTLELSSLDKIYFPAISATKGELMRYYARVAPLILPLLADRPLVLKRSPEGVEGETFFQQKPPAGIPAIVRVESIPAPVMDGERGKPERRVVGGDLATLLYAVQLGCISMDPWFSRVGNMEHADYAILDLDPGPEAGFAGVVHAARLVHEQLEQLGLRSALKTSGSRGLHIALPLPRGTSYESALRLAESIATRVAAAHPEETTIERSLAERPPAAVYLDYLQNARGKSVACAYCARARKGATVSTPLHWSELGNALDPGSFTIRSVPERLEELGDIWGDAMRRANTRKALASTLSKE